MNNLIIDQTIYFTHTHHMTKNLKENSNLKQECKIARSNGMKFDPTESPIIGINHPATCLTKGTTKQDSTCTHHACFLTCLKPNQRLEFENALLLISDSQI